jgi:two-component system, NarL family, sensor histidine kinase LiaS
MKKGNRMLHPLFHGVQRTLSKLQVRMALSYVVVTVSVVVLLEIVVYVLLITFGIGALQSVLANEMAQKYALLAADQGQGVALDPHTTFLPGQPMTLTIPNTSWSMGGIPYTHTMKNQPTAFVVLITPHGKVLASSYPSRYPNQASIGTLFPGQMKVIDDALHGISGSGSYTRATTFITYDAEPVWNWQKTPIGAIYLEFPKPTLTNIWGPVYTIVTDSGIVLLIIMTPLGALFGWLTTRRSVRRIHHLAAATSQFAAGDYTQRVPVSSTDEIGQLEDHFNRMAMQLVETIAQRQDLAGQNARLAERGRIARDLHDSIKQQVFAIGLKLGTALALLERDPAAGAKHVRQADALALQAQQELTTLIHELRPLALQAQGFFVALGETVATWGQQQSIATEVHIPTGGSLPPDVEDSLLRVTQEALANVARHSQAQHVQVILVNTDDQVTLTLVDDGRGFTPGATDVTGVGLSSMRERMQALGGSLTIESAPGQGTRIVAQCPIHS